MSDEPPEDDDSGSDAAGASSSSGSDERDEGGSHDEDEWTWGEEPQPRDPADDTDADDATAEDVDDAGVDAADEDDRADGDAASGADDGGDGDVTPSSPTGRPGYTDDHVTASGEDSGAGSDDPSADDPAADDQHAPDAENRSAADSGPAGADTNPGDHAPIGTQAPSPDESPSTTVTDTAGAGAGGGGGGGGGGGSSILSGGIGGTAPPDDEEMPLTAHIEEMLTRLAIVVVVASLATLAAFPFANDVIIQMWYDVHNGSVQACKPAPQSDGCVAPHVYGPLELVLTRIRVAGLVGLLVALPLAVYQIYRFMRPGLYPHERRYYLAAVPFSLVLGILGMTFAYFVLLPLLFEYFITYTEGSADLAFQLAETMNLVLLMMGMLAIIFQIPLLIMLAIMMGITTRRWLERRRLYFWGLFLGVAVIFGPDPTGMAPFLLTATMVALFEGTLLLLRWTGR